MLGVEHVRAVAAAAELPPGRVPDPNARGGQAVTHDRQRNVVHRRQRVRFAGGRAVAFGATDA